jgi:hypothetical protein
MRATDKAPTGSKRQPIKILAARYRAADAANLKAFEAWDHARNSFESIQECAYLWELFEATRKPRREALSAYRAAARTNWK